MADAGPGVLVNDDNRWSPVYAMLVYRIDMWVCFCLNNSIGVLVETAQLLYSRHTGSRASVDRSGDVIVRWDLI